MGKKKKAANEIIIDDEYYGLYESTKRWSDELYVRCNGSVGLLLKTHKSKCNSIQVHCLCGKDDQHEEENEGIVYSLEAWVEHCIGQELNRPDDQLDYTCLEKVTVHVPPDSPNYRWKQYDRQTLAALCYQETERAGGWALAGTRLWTYWYAEEARPPRQETEENIKKGLAKAMPLKKGKGGTDGVWFLGQVVGWDPEGCRLKLYYPSDNSYDWILYPLNLIHWEAAAPPNDMPLSVKRHPSHKAVNTEDPTQQLLASYQEAFERFMASTRATPVTSPDTGIKVKKAQAVKAESQDSETSSDEMAEMPLASRKRLQQAMSQQQSDELPEVAPSNKRHKGEPSGVQKNTIKVKVPPAVAGNHNKPAVSPTTAVAAPIAATRLGSKEAEVPGIQAAPIPPPPPTRQGSGVPGTLTQAAPVPPPSARQGSGKVPEAKKKPQQQAHQKGKAPGANGGIQKNYGDFDDLNESSPKKTKPTGPAAGVQAARLPRPTPFAQATAAVGDAGISHVALPPRSHVAGVATAARLGSRASVEPAAQQAVEQQNNQAQAPAQARNASLVSQASDASGFASGFRLPLQTLQSSVSFRENTLQSAITKHTQLAWKELLPSTQQLHALIQKDWDAWHAVEIDFGQVQLSGEDALNNAVLDTKSETQPIQRLFPGGKRIHDWFSTQVSLQQLRLFHAALLETAEGRHGVRSHHRIITPPMPGRNPVAAHLLLAANKSSERSRYIFPHTYEPPPTPAGGVSDRDRNIYTHMADNPVAFHFTLAHNTRPSVFAPQTGSDGTAGATANKGMPLSVVEVGQWQIMVLGCIDHRVLHSVGQDTPKQPTRAFLKLSYNKPRGLALPSTPALQEEWCTAISGCALQLAHLIAKWFHRIQPVMTNFGIAQAVLDSMFASDAYIKQLAKQHA